MSPSVVRPKVGMGEDVVYGADGDVVPAVPQLTGDMVRWWCPRSVGTSLGPNDAQELRDLGSVTEGLNDACSGKMEASGSSGDEAFVVDKKLWRFSHDGAPFRVDPALVPRMPGIEQRLRR